MKPRKRRVVLVGDSYHRAKVNYLCCKPNYKRVATAYHGYVDWLEIDATTLTEQRCMFRVNGWITCGIHRPDLALFYVA